MSKFCKNCGTALEDNAMFCTNCGANLSAPTQPMNQPPMNQPPMAQGGYVPVQPPMAQDGYAPEQNSPNTDKPSASFVQNLKDKANKLIEKAKELLNSNPKIKKYGIIGAGAVAAVILLVIIISIAFPSPKAVVNKYMKAFAKGDSKTLVNSVCEACYSDDWDEDDYLEYLDEFFEDAEIEDFEYEIKSIKDLSKSEIKDLEDDLEYIEEEYDNGFEADKVKDYKKVKVKVSYDYEHGDYSGTQELVLIKYKGQWKIFEF